ncbi:MAG TPA: hypothetical protein VNS32_23410 [Flavisolibacter sp.]|nr:hypothetical protein [Flavisolibacter sp.]
MARFIGTGLDHGFTSLDHSSGKLIALHSITKSCHSTSKQLPDENKSSRFTYGCTPMCGVQKAGVKWSKFLEVGF